MSAKQYSSQGAKRDASAREQAKPRATKTLTASKKGVLLALVKRMVDNSASEQAEGFDTERWLRQWLDQPNPALGCVRPIDMLATQEGTQTVRQLLSTMESGAYL